MTAKTKTKLLVTGVFALIGYLCAHAAADESAQTAAAQKPEKIYTFGEAVMAVADSDMLSCDKQEIIETIRRGETSDYYRGIIGIAGSDMLSSDKYDSIERLNEYRESNK